MSRQGENRGSYGQDSPKFTVTQEGSATWACPGGNPDIHLNTESPGAPYNTEPSLKWKCEDVGVEMDGLIDLLKKNHTNMEMARELGVSEAVVKGLKNEFFRYGLNSVVGKD